MKSNIKLLGDQVFRRYFYALFLSQICLWIVPAIMPVFLFDRYGLGNEFVMSLSLQWLPSILMGPIVGTAIDRYGAKRMTLVATGAFAIAFIVIPLTESLWQLQIVILILGICQSIHTPASLTLRAYVIPAGQEVAGNSLVIGTQRLGKMIGPLIAGLMAVYVGIDISFVAVALIIAPVIVALSFVQVQAPDVRSERDNANIFADMKARLCALVMNLMRNRIVLGMVVTAIGYTITLGGLRMVLFALSADLGNPEQNWALFLSAQGLGALVGAAISSSIITKVERKFSILQIYVVVSLIEVFVLGLLCVQVGLPFTLGILVIASIFETFAFVSYFTVIQTRVEKRMQGNFNSITLPLIDASFLIGMVLIGYLIDYMTWNVVFMLTLSFAIISVLVFLPTFLREK